MEGERRSPAMPSPGFVSQDGNFSLVSDHRRKTTRRIQAFFRRSISIIRDTGPPPFEARYERRSLAASAEFDVIVSMSNPTAIKNSRFMAVNLP
jgi:hypothetical protein